jgi:hypothetical protein
MIANEFAYALDPCLHDLLIVEAGVRFHYAFGRPFYRIMVEPESFEGDQFGEVRWQPRDLVSRQREDLCTD